MKAIIATILITLLLATPAFAEHTPEHRIQEANRLAELYSPNGEIATEYGIIMAYNPYSGYFGKTGLYGLAAYCQNFGGYWYLGVDGVYHWWSC